MLRVKEIQEFFNTDIDSGEAKSLNDLLHIIPSFVHFRDDNGAEEINWSVLQEYYTICQKMCDDMLLINVNPNFVIPVENKYIAVPHTVSSAPEELEKNLEYGYYDFKYRGFVYTRDYFVNSILAIDGIRTDGEPDIGTAFYIGEKKFVTAAHCIKDYLKFRLLKPDGSQFTLKEVWFANGYDTNAYDLAVIIVDDEIEIPEFELADPAILDDVLVIGYPPISGFNAIQTAETATVGAYQKSSTGQVVGTDRSYLLPLDFFLINARVKGGNSGGPVINNMGYVVGVVVKLPFDNQSDSNSPRYDLMGYGVCLPSKYIRQLMDTPKIMGLTLDGGYFRR